MVVTMKFLLVRLIQPNETFLSKQTLFQPVTKPYNPVRMIFFKFCLTPNLCYDRLWLQRSDTNTLTITPPDRLYDQSI